MHQTVPVEVSDEALQMIKEFASRQRMNTSMLLTSVAQFCTEWYIPAMSFGPVTVPKNICLRE
ncbi:MAG: hypothetical protein M3114_07230 [Thermoproteota archaeon]|nr:hypothetical protein [Thermoproteota archaeon]